ncbi:hypothetical protein IC229_35070 [Spirosoma sp. BT702]|uniref:Uncharacterized protein n=1 Tax=Spirosoma profusum TaxID=2771354 RepID=A0A927AWQ4_9BACT|nr:hypothetical protein [Spirosoma profusum]MBD2705873.1 hypothetical protein [Spirosoma profusum]
MGKSLSQSVGKKDVDVTRVSGGEMELSLKQALGLIDKGVILKSPPLFSPFVMYHYGDPRLWERIRCDIHWFMHVGPADKAILISNKVKSLFKSFAISEPYQFYSSELRFKNELYDYSILQLLNDWLINVDLVNSQYAIYRPATYPNVEIMPLETRVSSKEEFLRINSELIQNHKGRIRPTLLAFNQYSDLIRIAAGLEISGLYISERLKNAFEEEQITGVEFKESEMIFEFKDH